MSAETWDESREGVGTEWLANEDILDALAQETRQSQIAFEFMNHRFGGTRFALTNDDYRFTGANHGREIERQRRTNQPKRANRPAERRSRARIPGDHCICRIFASSQGRGVYEHREGT